MTSMMGVAFPRCARWFCTGRASRCGRSELPEPRPGPGQVLLEVPACGVCRTDLHVVDGELPEPEAAARARPPDRGAAWREGGERFARRRPGRRAVARLDRRDVPLLPRRAARTSATAPASPATRSTAATPSTSVADERFCFPLPEGYPDLQAAPLLCAGLIGYRALRHGRRRRAARPLRLRRRRPHHRPGGAPPGPARVRVHASRGRRRRRRFARELGAEWAGRLGGSAARGAGRARSSSRPVGELVPGRAAGRRRRAAPWCAPGIHMSDIPSFPYELLWGERVLRSVANLTRRRRRGVPATWRRGSRCARRWRRTRSARRTRRWHALRSGRGPGRGACLRASRRAARRP